MYQVLIDQIKDISLESQVSEDKPIWDIFDKDFKVSQETSTGTSQASTSVEGLTNNKTVMWLGIIVVGYFAYKQYKK